MAETQERTSEGIGTDVSDTPAARRTRQAQFRGSTVYAIDDKGRLTIPVSLRKPLMSGAVMTVLDGRTVAWSVAAFEFVIETLEARVPSGAIEADQIRRFAARVHNVTPDAQGRIVIPVEIRVEGGLERDIRISGTGSRIEFVPVDPSEVDEGIAQAIVDVIDLEML